jgi:hypothetical protein
MRSLILALDASAQTFERPDIHARFQHSPDEQARQPDTKIQPIMREKRLHVPRPFLGNSRVEQHTDKPQANIPGASILRDLSWLGQDSFAKAWCVFVNPLL